MIIYLFYFIFQTSKEGMNDLTLGWRMHVILKTDK